MRYDHSAVLTRPRPHVDHIVGMADRVLVVFHHDHAVTHVAQTVERGQKAVIVALMQPDGRLVQHIHHAGQSGAYLGCEPDALRFATGQRLGGACKRQVIEADVVKKGQPAGNFMHDFFRDRLFLSLQLQFLKEMQRQFKRHIADFKKILVFKAHVARLQTQSRTLAFRAGAAIEVFRQFLAHRGRISLLVASLQIVDDTLEGVFAQHRFASVVHVLERDFFTPGAVQDDLLDVVRQAFEGLLQIEVVMAGQAGQQLVIELIAPVPALDGSRTQGQRGESDDALGIEKTDDAQAVALGACAHRVVERKQARFEFRQRVVADRTGEFGREHVLDVCVHFHRNRASVGMAQRGFERFGQPLFGIRIDFQPVHHDLDGVFPGLLQ